MIEIDKYLAKRTLESLPLSEGSRRFAEWWLSLVESDGGPQPNAPTVPPPSDLAASTLVFEVRPWSTVLCRSSGINVDRALGVSLAGRDMLALVPPANRPTRLSRFARVAAGGLQLSNRDLVAADGTNRRVQELLLPHPDSRVAPQEPAATMTIAYIDTNAVFVGKRILVSRGAFDIAEEPLFVDLRAPSLVVASD